MSNELCPTPAASALHADLRAFGLLALQGEDAMDLLQRLGSGDMRPLAAPHAVGQTLLLTNQGKLVDWLWVLNLPPALPPAVYLVTSPGRQDRVRLWLEQFIIMEDVQVRDCTEDLCGLWLQGDGAAQALRLEQWSAVSTQDAAAIPSQQSAACPALASLGGAWFRDPTNATQQWVGILPQAQAPHAHETLRAAGATPRTPVQLEVQRICAGIPGHLTEYAAPVAPLELRLKRHAIAWNKGCYIGQEVVSRLDSYDKVARLLMGFWVPGAHSVQPEQRIVSTTGQPLGRVTSLTWDAAADRSVGLCLVKRQAASAGPALLQTGEAQQPLELEDRPFF
jgi:folate-binding protein YgfZ